MHSAASRYIRPDSPGRPGATAYSFLLLLLLLDLDSFKNDIHNMYIIFYNLYY